MMDVTRYMFGESGTREPRFDSADAAAVELIGASAEKLNSLLESAATDIVVFQPGATDSDLTESHLATFASSGKAIGLLFREPSEAFVWEGMPSSIAAFVTPPETHCSYIVVDRSRLSTAPFRDVASPVHELAIRLCNDAPSSAGVVSLESRAVEEAAWLPADCDLPEIAPRRPTGENDWIAEHLRAVPDCDWFSAIRSEVEATAIHAGLWQIHDFLDESHNLAQSIEGEGADANGDYWHAIMHRREPDWSNAKYWFRRVGHHPCFDHLAGCAARILSDCSSPDAETWKRKLCVSSGWEAFAFVDLCRSVTEGPDQELASAARQIQWAEMLLLLKHCCKSAGV